MKKSRMWFTSIALMLALVGCGDDKAASPSIVGNWLKLSKNGVSFAEKDSAFVIYKSDNNWEAQSIKGVQTETAAYKFENGKVSFPNTPEFVYNVEITATQMTFKGTGAGDTSSYVYKRVSDQEKAQISARN